MRRRLAAVYAQATTQSRALRTCPPPTPRTFIVAHARLQLLRSFSIIVIVLAGFTALRTFIAGARHRPSSSLTIFLGEMGMNTVCRFKKRHSFATHAALRRATHPTPHTTTHTTHPHTTHTYVCRLRFETPDPSFLRILFRLRITLVV